MTHSSPEWVFFEVMKRLTLIRHAKSDWDSGRSDFDRPLNERGEAAAPYMATRLARHYVPPDLLVSSPAARALRTAVLIARGIGIAETAVRTEAGLYNASARQLLDCIRATDEGIDHLMLVAHNPGVTDLANELTGSRIDQLVTCAVLGVDLETGSWREVRPGCGRVCYFDYPKNPSPPEQRD
jgi:phosphohistidine phosphatase